MPSPLWESLNVVSMYVVPVWIMHRTSKVLDTYAMLDSCSQGTFMDEQLLDELQILGRKTTITVKILNGEATELTRVAEGLEVANGGRKTHQKARWIAPPKTYGRKERCSRKWFCETKYLYHSKTRLYLYISMHINLQLTYQEIFIYIVLQKGCNQLVFDWILCAKACGSNTNPLLYKHEIVKLHDKVIYWKLPLHQILIFHQFLIIGLPFPQALIRHKTSCSSKGFLKVNIANTKKYGREALIYTATYIIMEWY